MVKFFATVCLFFSVAVYACELTVRFESYTDNLPEENKDQHYGIDVHYAKALLEEAGCRYRFVNIPWARSIELLKVGKIDMMLALSYTQERSEFIHFLGPQRDETLVVATLEDFDEKLIDFSDIRFLAKPIAAQEGAMYGDKYNKFFQAFAPEDRNVIDVSNNHIKLTLLRKGRISGFIEEKYTVLHQAMVNPAFHGVVIQPLVINTSPVYIGLSKAGVSEEVRDRLEQALIRLKARDEFGRLLQQMGIDKELANTH